MKILNVNVMHKVLMDTYRCNSRQKVALGIQQVDMSCNNVRRDFWAESVNVQVFPTPTVTC